MGINDEVSLNDVAYGAHERITSLEGTINELEERVSQLEEKEKVAKVAGGG